MLRQTLALILLVAGTAAAGCNQTVHSQPPGSRAEPAPQTGSSTNYGSSTSSGNSTSNVRQVELANLRADVQSLDRRVREMDLALEELARENSRLKAELERRSRGEGDRLRDVVRRDQLDSAISDLAQRLRQADSDQTRQILAKVSEQIEELGRTTQAAIDAMARNVSARSAGSSSSSSSSRRSSPDFSDDFPQTGVTYTVQRGDSLSSIASRHNSTIRDIQNANRISNPERIQVGQVLFIPQRED